MLAAFLFSLFGFIFCNIPIAFALVLTAVVMMMLTGDVSAGLLARNMIRGIDSFTLLAIPFFMLAGEIMNEGGISMRIVQFARSLIGHVSGGLGYVGVIASMIFSGVSGSAVADTSAIGSTILPVMEKEGYDKRKSTALICAAGCIGPIIPPSIPMILFGVIGGVSIVKLFVGGIIPGILIGVGLMFVWYLHARKNNYATDGEFQWANVRSSAKSASWALLLPVIIMGGILSGICTPTEAAVVAVVYAFIVSLFIYKELDLRRMPGILVKAGKSTAIVLLVVGTATSAAYLITTAHIPEMLTATLLGMSNNVYVIMLLINILLLMVGCVMDLTPALLVLAPILLPIVESFGLDPVYFGVVMTVNLCIGLITPPVGVVLYVGCGLSKLAIGDLVRPILDMIAVMIAVLILITYVPSVITFLPGLLK